MAPCKDLPKSSKVDAPAGRLVALLPGILLCVLLTLLSIGIQEAEEHIFQHPYVEALVIAILLGMMIRSVSTTSERWKVGIAFSAKQLLEVAVMLLGASISFGAILPSGLFLIAAIVGTVAVTLAVSFGLSRMLGLPTKLSLLIASGNSICGNSAIAAVAPVIGADGDDIASSISFTAVLGVLMVLGLPLLIPLLELSATQYGILAGLTVYAVPQVLAATVPAGIVSTQIGTVVKLVRVLMLGPLVVGLSLVAPRLRGEVAPGKRINLIKLVPWFIIGFLVLAGLRSLQIIPSSVAAPVAKLASVLTVVSMSALGLGVDIRVLSKAGGKVTIAVTLSLILLLAMSLGLVQLFK
ncbi:MULTISPECIES: YeiH family protein [Bradyrhizobium]|uniref:Sulfate exporter family transporter n=3 Tax=Bradyrhizobium TaxID=374 RepID=A0AAE6CCZ2_9BRAD|nr:MULTISPECIES: putative sulfate exporter family transporter [Bradyrhizobium]MCG2629324.1 putative sulfate exporter family transporter [Bradyrhizobium zhengyangense]MCG2644605.1 putative sulfate exporter family transporter [Bradyrhizobium zhengyangense]MCG2670838.1 putative sulfate exporter family transporter [Bradyrhizobium zhengyangense]MDN4984470.1 putative sulfate exporter family transporter [Bradyrhizobium sp. WYCCWR 13022]MDN5002462.1 putative sulfate exporter family transporter [Bradyr